MWDRSLAGRMTEQEGSLHIAVSLRNCEGLLSRVHL